MVDPETRVGLKTGVRRIAQGGRSGARSRVGALPQFLLEAFRRGVNRRAERRG
jgi:hypothetical protein